MTETVLPARVGASRGAAGSLVRGELLPIPLPDRFLKEEPGTLVWFGMLGGGEETVFKAYLRRSPLTRWRAPFIRYRVEREYDALRVLEAAGVPVSEPLLWGRGASPRHGRFEVLAVRRIPGARSVRDRMAEGEIPRDPAALSPLFRHVRALHGAGVHHGALSWKNVLATDAGSGDAGSADAGSGDAGSGDAGSGDAGSGAGRGGDRGGGGWRFHIVDFAKALRYGGDIFGTRMARYDLLRLTSHLGRAFSTELCLFWLGEYGLDAARARRLLDDLSGYPPPRLVHQRLRLEFALRSLVSFRS